MIRILIPGYDLARCYIRKLQAATRCATKQKQTKQKRTKLIIRRSTFSGFIVAGGGHIFLLYVQYTLYTSLLEI